MSRKPAFSLPVRAAVREIKPYVPGKPIEAVQRELGLTGVIKLASNENPLGPSPKAVAAATAALSRTHMYPEGDSPVLRAVLAERWGVPPDWVFVGNGTDEVFRLLAETYLEPGDRVVVPTPGFSTYTIVTQLMGGVAVPVPCRGGANDLPAMAVAALGSDGAPPAKLIFLCRPNNPTGGVFPASALSAFLAMIPPEVLVILDEAYQEYDTSEFDSKAFLDAHPNLMISHTFSKIYGLAGLRLGYAVARPEVLTPLYTVREPFSVNIPAQAAGLAALDDVGHVAASRESNERGKAYLDAALRGLGLSPQPTEANFILVDLGRPAAPIYQAMMRRGVIVRPCGSFGLPTCLRITIGCEAESLRCMEALKAVLKD